MTFISFLILCFHSIINRMKKILRLSIIKFLFLYKIIFKGVACSIIANQFLKKIFILSWKFGQYRSIWLTIKILNTTSDKKDILLLDMCPTYKLYKKMKFKKISVSQLSKYYKQSSLLSPCQAHKAFILERGMLGAHHNVSPKFQFQRPYRGR